MRIAVAVSGGVDSLCALWRLHQDGHEVLAVHGLFLPPGEDIPPRQTADDALSATVRLPASCGSATGDLPPLEDFAPDDEVSALLREGLSAHAHFGLVEEDEMSWTGSEDDIDQIEGSDSAQNEMRQALRDALSDALAQSAGVVEKIDFDALEFEE